ncbi:hypothetical protein DGMP_25320 [Desulfomarina profundi]|uniref:Uncharacterized protein n=1 Tax=Desulfomarina profundi TaxID=2772557 RepID=A0A8D5FUB4_9BACT|nr:hypothetical protein [Desulfomarina profundi]BCL61839.1 hypothetical protein DGMP_25320 [Desulfomarina profundi]
MKYWTQEILRNWWIFKKKNDYLMHHFSHSVQTAAYPVKSELDKKRLAPVISKLQQTDGRIIIVGPGEKVLPKEHSDI